MKLAIITLSPVPTGSRVDMFPSVAGVGAGSNGCQDESPGRGPAVLSVTLCWSLPSEFITHSSCVVAGGLYVLNKIFNPSGDHSGSSLAEGSVVWVSCVRPVPSELIVQICPPLWFSTPDQKAILPLVG